MNTFIKLIKDRNLAFKISLFYVSFGTLAVCSVYPKDLFYGDWSLYGLLLTIPVSVVSFGFRYAESNLLYPVFIIQLKMFFISFFLLSLFIKDKKI